MTPRRFSRAIAAVWLFAGSAAARPTFTDVTVSAGVTYEQHRLYDPPDCIFGSGYWCEPDRMSGGAAVADVDGDGNVDLFVTRLDLPNLLFRNLGNGTFQDVTAGSGLDLPGLQSNGAAFADVDNDGDPDLYLTVLGESGHALNDRNYLFINDGQGHFTEEAIARGAAIASTASNRSFSVAFGDYDRDGWLDFFTTEWAPYGSTNWRLRRNRGAAAPGRFLDVTGAAGIDMSAGFGFAASFSDLDGDGWPDLAVAADYGTSRLFWNNGNGTFLNGTSAAGVGTDENGMGSTIGDFDGDGDLDWFVTSIFDPNDTCAGGGCSWGTTGNRLYLNNGSRSFSDATDLAGVRDGAWGWGAAFFDYDNDGDLDLAMTNGIDLPLQSIDAPFNADAVRFWENQGAAGMTEIAGTVGLVDTGSGKGLLVFDYDKDGDLDLFLVNNGGVPRLYRNDGGNAKSWLRVRTIGSADNRDGLGTRVSVRAVPAGPVQVREIGSATHFLAQSQYDAHFGLGDGTAPIAEVLVRWPNGKTQGFTQVPRNGTLLVRQADCVVADGNGLCIQPSGQVPDGWTVPGMPLKLAKGPGGTIALSWSGSCSAADQDYEVYEGPIGNMQQLVPRLCTTSGATTASLLPADGNRGFLVVPRTFSREGSYGKRRDGTQRTASPSACLPQAIVSCP